MTTYYVDGKAGKDSNNGSSESPWKTLSKAEASIKAGDEVRIRSATYHEQLKIQVPNTVWRADTGHNPSLDGKYNDSVMYKDANGHDRVSAPRPEHLPTGEWGAMLSISANGIVVDGLVIQNCAGFGISIGSFTDIVVRNCRIDFTYLNNLNIAGGAGWGDRIVIENNILTRGSVKTLLPGYNRRGGGLSVGRARDCIVRNNIVAFIWGEGIDIHRGAVRTIVEGNVVHTVRAVHIYIQRAKDNIIRNNLVYHTGNKSFVSLRTGAGGVGIMIADELGSAAFPHSSGDHIYNNIVIGTSKLFVVGNGSPLQNTQLNKSYIGFNTFIGDASTLAGISILDNTTEPDRSHVNSIFENNIISNVPDSRPIGVAGSKIGGLLFRNNLWDRLPPAQMRGNGDRIGNPSLVNPTAVISDTGDLTAIIDPRNYQLTSKSNLAIGMASGGSASNGLTPPPIRKDFFGANRDNRPDIGAHEYAGVTIELTANFSIGPGQVAGPLPHTVDFIDKSTSTRPIVSRQWNFGDNEISTETNPSHTFTKVGNFDVSLTITDDKGNTNTMTQEGLISVTDVPNTVLPDSFRRFVLLRQDQQAVLAYGTQYPDLNCILIWNKDPFHILNFDSIQDVEESNLESGNFIILWIDPSSQIEPSGDELVPEPTVV
ncbi:MAG: right-handed parallel beta-helix repeat-containing protein [Candidatus Promineofilum sp.]|nr:right-handed parallel beta-helix repeat-containing protein [Promineifilum sp.]